MIWVVAEVYLLETVARRKDSEAVVKLCYGGLSGRHDSSASQRSTEGIVSR